MWLLFFKILVPVEAMRRHQSNRALIFTQSTESKPEIAKLGFDRSEAFPMRTTTIFLLGMTSMRWSLALLVATI